MPKMKSRRGAMKRFRTTGSGKVRRHKAFGSHILTKKSTKRKRGLREATLASSGDADRIRKMILEA
ncbi:MAG: 50S ribosomal protein L35 [Candidatus Krumholzibacteria bacterium]|jgi:large subunit ribosomal protein L35|nr:50S ribosomal protein L35 [Candidatus Krumholzibacteria bacterium]MDP6669175.1 50S ribosomal protein L35 [Candidatus Krumholzibacteria bacterium]MDP6797949.1 50S ribosomal protein L35 [Candidatus Krumholzibacteria bacterium]MDP7020857.1 50S ribosomal protein L35 [Candidatus Krumholzibacteria bacterium]